MTRKANRNERLCAGHDCEIVEWCVERRIWQRVLISSEVEDSGKNPASDETRTMHLQHLRPLDHFVTCRERLQGLQMQQQSAARGHGAERQRGSALCPLGRCRTRGGDLRYGTAQPHSQAARPFHEFHVSVSHPPLTVCRITHTISKFSSTHQGIYTCSVQTSNGEKRRVKRSIKVSLRRWQRSSVGAKDEDRRELR